MKYEEDEDDVQNKDEFEWEFGAEERKKERQIWGGEDGGTMGQKNTNCVKCENRKSCEK